MRITHAAQQDSAEYIKNENIYTLGLMYLYCDNLYEIHIEPVMPLGAPMTRVRTRVVRDRPNCGSASGRVQDPHFFAGFHNFAGRVLDFQIFASPLHLKFYRYGL